MSTPKPQVRLDRRKPKVVVEVERRQPKVVVEVEVGRKGRGAGRARIIAAALDLFAARGFSDVSMADVARAAGVTKAALYYHFTDKVDLYTTVALQRIASIHQAMEEASHEWRHARGAPPAARGRRASSGWSLTSMRPISMRTITSTTRTTSSCTRRWTSSRSP